MTDTPHSAMLQIGLIASPHQTSGSDRYYFELLRALRERGEALRGVVLGDPRAVTDPLDEVASFAPEGSRALRRWTGLRRVVGPLARRSSLVVSHMAAHAFPVLDQIADRPFVVHFHGPWALEGLAGGIRGPRYLLREVQERSVYGRARRVIALSHAFADILIEHYGVDPELIAVIPGGVDVQRFAPTITRAQARERLGWPADRPTIATVRRLVPTKGIEELIDAAARVRRDIPDLFVAIAGTGALKPELERRVTERGLRDTVHFAGFISDDDLPVLYRAADALVVPTQAFEGFGLVVIEALACGTPALVTPVGGLPEVVRDLDPRLVFDDASAAAIARGVRAAFDGSWSLPDAAACTAYAARFAWPAIAERVQTVYRDVA